MIEVELDRYGRKLGGLLRDPGGAMMKPYFYQGKISPELRRHILSNAPRFQEIMRRSIEAFSGKLVRCHLSAATSEPIGFLDFPDDISARSWNAYYAGQEGVLSSVISRLLDDEDLAAMAAKVVECGEVANAHRPADGGGASIDG